MAHIETVRLLLKQLSLSTMLIHGERLESEHRVRYTRLAQYLAELEAIADMSGTFKPIIKPLGYRWQNRITSCLTC